MSKVSMPALSMPERTTTSTSIPTCTSCHASPARVSISRPTPNGSTSVRSPSAEPNPRRPGGSHRIGRMPSEPLLEVRDLSIHLLPHREILRGVSFDIPTGTIAGLSGNSGSGKTTLALALLKLLPPAQYRVGGQVLLRARHLLTLDERALQSVRGAQVAMIFQDPLLALNPVLRIQIGRASCRERV